MSFLKRALLYGCFALFISVSSGCTPIMYGASYGDPYNPFPPSIYAVPPVYYPYPYYYPYYYPQPYCPPFWGGFHGGHHGGGHHHR